MRDVGREQDASNHIYWEWCRTSLRRAVWIARGLDLFAWALWPEPRQAMRAGGVSSRAVASAKIREREWPILVTTPPRTGNSLAGLGRATTTNASWRTGRTAPAAAWNDKRDGSLAHAAALRPPHPPGHCAARGGVGRTGRAQGVEHREAAVALRRGKTVLSFVPRCAAGSSCSIQGPHRSCTQRLGSGGRRGPPPALSLQMHVCVRDRSGQTMGGMKRSKEKKEGVTRQSASEAHLIRREWGSLSTHRGRKSHTPVLLPLGLWPPTANDAAGSCCCPATLAIQCRLTYRDHTCADPLTH